MERKIADLPSGHLRKQARKARIFLMQHASSEYATFAHRHEVFLQRAENEPELDPKLPLRFLEEPGLECAVWPDLYFHADLCETVERATDTRRLHRQPFDQQQRADALSDSEDNPEEAAEEPGRHSVRRSFLRKVLGPIIDYSMDYELMQFVFDLCMWSDIGSKRHALQHMPLRLALKQQPWTPAYWAQRHAALLDLQRQCGPPVLFKTWAPYEWSAPYHSWLLDSMTNGHRSRQHLAGPETLHLTHIMTEMFREWAHGGAVKNGPSSKRWSASALSADGGPHARGSRVPSSPAARCCLPDRAHTVPAPFHVFDASRVSAGPDVVFLRRALLAVSISREALAKNT